MKCCWGIGHLQNLEVQPHILLINYKDKYERYLLGQVVTLNISNNEANQTDKHAPHDVMH